jgi:hypothetical protein
MGISAPCRRKPWSPKDRPHVSSVKQQAEAGETVNSSTQIENIAVEIRRKSSPSTRLCVQQANLEIPNEHAIPYENSADCLRTNATDLALERFFELWKAE